MADEKDLVWMMFDPDGNPALSHPYDDEPPMGLRYRMINEGYSFKQFRESECPVKATTSEA